VLTHRSIQLAAMAAGALTGTLAVAQPNQYAGEAVAFALEAQEYAIGIARTAASDADPAAAVESAQRAIGTARRALELDNTTALAFSVLGIANRELWHWPEARAAFEQAYALDENDPSIAFNPGSANAHRDLGIAFAFAGNEEGARAALGQCIAADPDMGICHIYLGFMLMRLGSYAPAEAELRAAERLFGDGMSPSAASSLAHAYWRTGLSADAERLFERLDAMAAERVVGAGSWPLAYLAIGDDESAYESLTRAVEKTERFEPDEGFFNLMIIKHNVQENPVLDEPRFRMLRDRIGDAQRSLE
jgi:tetratricopeptide (TPR) repeat protein